MEGGHGRGDVVSGRVLEIGARHPVEGLVVDHRGGDVAGGDGVDRHPEPRPSRGRPTCTARSPPTSTPHRPGCPGCAVRPIIEEIPIIRPPRWAAHVRCRRPHGVEHAGEIGVDGLVPLGGTGGEDRAQRGDARRWPPGCRPSPGCAAASSTKATMASSSRTSTTAERQRPPVAFDQAHRLGQIVLGAQRIADAAQVVAEVAHGDVGAQPGQFDGVAPALAPGPAGDHRHPAGERRLAGSLRSSFLRSGRIGRAVRTCADDTGRRPAADCRRLDGRRGPRLLKRLPVPPVPRLRSPSRNPGRANPRGAARRGGAGRPGGDGARRRTARSRGRAGPGPVGGRRSSRSRRSRARSAHPWRSQRPAASATGSPSGVAVNTVDIGIVSRIGNEVEVVGPQPHPFALLGQPGQGQPPAAGQPLLGRPARGGHHHQAPRSRPRAGAAPPAAGLTTETIEQVAGQPVPSPSRPWSPRRWRPSG